MRNRLVLTAVLAMLVSGPLVTSVPAAPAGGASTLRPWGKGHTAPQPSQAARLAAAGATRLVVIGREADFTIEGIGLTFAVTGGTGEFRKARGQMHETFLPTGEFRFAFTLFL
jgi:hypothetical protein